MSKLTTIKNAISRTTGRGGLLLKKNSPEILLGVGVVGIIASTVMACKATLKVDDILNDADEKIGKINSVRDRYINTETAEGVEVKYSEKDAQKDTLLVKFKTVGQIAKIYAPAVTLGIASLGCILTSHGIMRKRNLAVIAAYKAVEQGFSDYRKRVISELGEEKDREFRYGIKKEKITVTETDEKGKEKKTEKIIETIDPNNHSPYAVFFDESSIHWTKTAEYNKLFLQTQQNFANDLLHSRKHIFLNEVYDMLGLPRTQAGAVVGWVKGHGDDYVDFGIFDRESEKARDFVNGYERSILLDFNVAGVIYDLI